MGRPRKPYFRTANGWWVSRFHGEYVKLARGLENEAEAKKPFHELMALEAASTPVESADVTAAALCLGPRGASNAPSVQCPSAAS
jgi:hypothetical protein